MKNARKTLVWASFALPITANAQVVAPIQLNASPVTPTNTNVEVGGTPAIDIIRLASNSTGAPLRFGGVLKGSESVTLNGVTLSPGKDYAFDYSVGVVYVNRAVKDGDSLTVSYRYDTMKKVDSGSALTGVAPMKFNLMGGMQMRMGLGSVERTADGKVMRSNVFGTRNAFSGGAASLSGAYFSGSRAQESVQSGMSFNGDKGGTLGSEVGNSSFLLQAFRTNLAGSALTVDYQDISSNFSGFGAVKEAGYNDQQVGAFSRERGLKRTGLGIEGLKMGGLSFSGKRSGIDNEGKGIDISSFSVGSKGLAFSSNTERIERGFDRFKDLGVADWQRMQASQGISKTSDAASWQSKFGAIKYESSRISDFERSKDIERTKYSFDSKNWAFEMGTQSVDSGFNRFEAERGAFGLEAGLRRQSVALTKGAVAPGLSLGFSQNSITGDKGSFDAQDIAITGKTWSVTSVSRGSDAGFGRIGSLTAPEIDGHIRSIGNMYAPNAPLSVHDRNAFIGSSGVRREQTQLKSSLGKGATMMFNKVDVGSQSSGASIHSVNVDAKNLQFSIRRLNTGQAFNEITRLMPYEQQQIGTLLGFNRTDADLGLNLGKSGTINVSRMDAEQNGAGVSRTNVAYRGTGLEVDYNQRTAAQAFNGMGGLVDPQRDLLASLTGFNQQDSRVKYSALKNIRFEYAQSSAKHESNTEERLSDSLQFAWMLDPTLQLEYAKANQVNKNSASTLFAANMERISLSKRFGSQQLSVSTEKNQNDGTYNQAPDSNKTTIALETKLSSTTSFRTEQSRTSFTDGGKEDVNSNSISTKVTKNVGVSLTESNIDRGSSERNEVKRDYGVWFDLGKGVRATYGLVRNTNGDAVGFGTGTWAIGQGVDRISAEQAGQGVNAANLNGTQLGYASGYNSWDAQNGRMQSFNSASIATTKPFSLGFLSNSKFSLTAYSAANENRLLREDILSNFDSKIGKYSVGFGYRGQVDASGGRAMDRTYRIKTDDSGKAPLSASMMYKQRELPNGDDFAIRDLQMTWKGLKGFTLSNQIQTNPEGPANPNVLLGTVPLAQRRNTWRLDYTANSAFTFGGQFDELIDDNAKSLRRTAGFNLSLFQKSGSPLSLFYGMEQSSLAGLNQDFVRYGLTFDQRPSANQSFSISLTNQGWLRNANSTLANSSDWVGRLSYQWRFK